MGAAGHELFVVDRAMLPRDDDTIPSVPDVLSNDETTTFSSTASTTGSGDVRALFLFANNVGNQSVMTANIISEFNNALSRSDVASSNKLSLAGIRTVASGFTGEKACKGKILYDMHSRNPPFTDIDQWMSDNAADIAFLIVENGPVNVDCPETDTFDAPTRIGGASTGFFPGDAGIQDHSESPFSMSSETFALGDLTALHEIGHTLGGRHADFSTSIEMDFVNGEFAHGFDNDNAGEWQTIMGGYRFSTADRCGFDFDNPDPTTQPCERIPYFSNPDKSATINGQFVPTLGTTTITGTLGDVNAQFKADMETWLETSGMPIVSGYFQDPSPPSSAPVLDVIPGHCWGLFDVTWTSVSGATNYRLYRSRSSSFASPTLVFDGSGTFATINVPESTTWYLQVKACNSGGCGPWSNQESATWVNGCF